MTVAEYLWHPQLPSGHAWGWVRGVVLLSVTRYADTGPKIYYLSVYHVLITLVLTTHANKADVISWGQ